MLFLTMKSMPLVAFLVVMDINHVISSVCNIGCWSIFWHSINVKGSKIDASLLKVSATRLNVKIFFSYLFYV